jgi:hypothetical protein
MYRGFQAETEDELADFVRPTRLVTGEDRLWSIAYCTRMRTRLTDCQLAHLAIDAQTRNKSLAVTGVLLYRGDQFIQVLEGPRGAVNWLYAKVLSDPRISDAVTLRDAAIGQRAFAQWFMRLLTIDDLSARERRLVSEALHASTRHVAAEANGLEALMACPAALISGAFRLSAGASDATRPGPIRARMTSGPGVLTRM